MQLKRLIRIVIMSIILFILLGSVGAYELNKISDTEIIIRSIVCMGAMALY